MDDPIIDRVANRYFRHALFSVRNMGLIVITISTVLWIEGGWDGTVESTVLGPRVYGLGLHWSTIQTFMLFWYLLTVNMQVGGLKTLRQLKSEIEKDLRTIELQIILFYRIAFDHHREKTTREEFADIRGRYADSGPVDPIRGAAFGFLFSAIGVLAFENVWVPLYDYSEFGNWLWPVFYNQAPWGNPFLGPAWDRNVWIFLFASFVAIIMLYTIGEVNQVLFPDFKIRKIFTPHIEIKWRLDHFTFAFIFLASAFWFIWYFTPHQVITLGSLASSQVFAPHPLTEAQIQNVSHWVFPNMSYFPQTEYTFYNASVYLHSYGQGSLFGFNLEDDWIHLVNITTKYLMFAAICYPAMLTVKRRGNQAEANGSSEVR